MAQITLFNVTFAYDGNPEAVFSDFSLGFDSDWRLGVVARNGRGKTTLLKLLTGQLQPDSGTIHLPRGSRPLLFPPEVDFGSRACTRAIMMQVAPDLEEWRLTREFSLLSVDAALLERPFCTLSPGEQGKALLAALFAQEDAFVLLDEPGNHLDINGKQMLTGYLSGKRSFLLVSHERGLLDAVTDHTLALLKSGPEIVAGAYHVWAEHRQRTEQFERAENARLSREITLLSESARQSGQWAEKAHRDSTKDDGSGVKIGRKEKNRVKAAKLERRAKQTIRQKERAAAQKETLLHDIEENEALQMRPLDFHSEHLLTATDLSLWYDSKRLLEPTSFRLSKGERLCLTGANGAGKSTLLQLIAGNPPPDALHISGSLHRPKGIRLSVLPQTSALPPVKLMEYVRQRTSDLTKVLTLLSKMGFSKKVFEDEVSGLSAGQKRKLLLSLSICEEAHLYLWDEPLNYLDIETREQIEDVLLKARPTLIFTEHDTYFCEKIATRCIALPAGIK